MLLKLLPTCCGSSVCISTIQGIQSDYHFRVHQSRCHSFISKVIGSCVLMIAFLESYKDLQRILMVV